MTTQHITSHYEQLSISICRNPQKCHHLGSRYQMMIEKSQFRIRFPCLPNNEVLFSDPISYHEYNIIHRLKKYQCNIDILKQLCGKMLNTYDDIKMIKNSKMFLLIALPNTPNGTSSAVRRVFLLSMRLL